MRRQRVKPEENPAKKMAKNIRTFAFITCLVVIAVIFIFYRHKQEGPADSGSGAASTADKLIQKDLELGYPATPTEVLKLLGRINQCMYNTGVSDEQFDQLLNQIRALYSTSLLEQNPLEEHRKNITAEIEEFQSAKRKIVNYTVEKSGSVDYRTIDGQSCAYVQTAYFMNEKGKYSKSYQDYVLVQEEDKWKILSFKKNEKANQEANQEAPKDS